MERKSYLVSLVVNNLHIERVVIDQHYKIKHAASMTDQIILELVCLLNQKRILQESEFNQFKYFTSDPLILKNKPYKLVWLLELNKNYIGVINAYRR